WLLEHKPQADDEANGHQVVTTNGKPLDLAALESLLGTSDREIMVDIIQEFVSAARESWTGVHGCAESSDHLALTRAAHGAKGEARNAGALYLGDLYERLESIARHNDRSEVAELLAAIPIELQRVETFADEFIAGRTLQ